MATKLRLSTTITPPAPKRAELVRFVTDPHIFREMLKRAVKGDWLFKRYFEEVYGLKVYDKYEINLIEGLHREKEREEEQWKRFLNEVEI